MFVVKNYKPPVENRTAFSLIQFREENPDAGIMYTPVFETSRITFPTTCLVPVSTDSKIHCHISRYLLASVRKKTLPLKPLPTFDYVHSGLYFNKKTHAKSSEKWGTSEFIDDALSRFFTVLFSLTI